jgi:hypothetical protein
MKKSQWVPQRRAVDKNATDLKNRAMRYMSCFERAALMCMNRTNGVGRHTVVIPEVLSLEPKGVVTWWTILIKPSSIINGTQTGETWAASKAIGISKSSRATRVVQDREDQGISVRGCTLTHSKDSYPQPEKAPRLGKPYIAPLMGLAIVRV